MIAALYVRTGGIYFDVPGVDPWDEARDARNYSGPWPVVAHPPCARWCMLAPVNEARYGIKRAQDGGTFKVALATVRRYGGVLEHPAHSLAWRHFDLALPVYGCWQRSIMNPCEWSAEVYQRNYGHAALKKTWLVYVGATPPPALDWSEPPPPEAWCSTDRPTARLPARHLAHGKSSHTPPAFRDLLIRMAEGAA